MSATEVKRTTATTAEALNEAMRSYQNVLKSAVQLQEESVKLWKDVLTKLGSPEEFQAKLDSLKADAFAKARKRTEEFVETFNRTSNQTIDLFENSLAVLRVNIHSGLNTNAKIIASWKELVDRFAPAVK